MANAHSSGARGNGGHSGGGSGIRAHKPIRLTGNSREGRSFDAWLANVSRHFGNVITALLYTELYSPEELYYMTYGQQAIMNSTETYVGKWHAFIEAVAASLNIIASRVNRTE